MSRFLCVFLASLLAAAGAAPAATYLVWTNGNNTPPYDTWATAATEMQTAVDAASSGDLVLVTNGVYTTSNIDATTVVTIEKDITVRGMGRGLTTISGLNADRVVLINAANALFEGFTVTDGLRPTLQYGPGISMTGGTVRDCLITNNVQSGRQTKGGGVYMVGGRLEDCEIVNNRAAGSDGGGYGSGVYANSGATIERCRIHGNTATASSSVAAGAVYLYNNSTIRNCLIYGNTAGGANTPSPNGGSGYATTYTAGVYSYASGNRIENCTIVGNVAELGEGAGMYLRYGYATNNIVYYNYTQHRGSYRTLHHNLRKTEGSASAVVASSCAYPHVEGPGNTNAPPLFADWENGDFSLLPGSPCLDSAVAVAGLTNDLYGTARPIDGDGDGAAAPDMGAIEAQAASSGSLRGSFAATGNEAVGSALVTFTAHAAGPNTNGLVYRWDFENDGTYDSSGADRRTVTRAYATPGLYSVALSISNTLGEAVLVRSNDVRVAPQTVYAATNGGNVFPYDSWATAATDIQDALNAALVTAADATDVLVSNGTYRLTSQVIVDKSVSLGSLAGHSNTVLNAQGTYGLRVMELFQGASGAVVDGFTLTGGNLPGYWYGSGVNLFDGTLQNCVISNNIGHPRLARGGGILMWDGVVRGCRIEGNTAPGSDGGGYGGGVYAMAGLIDGCWIRGNSASSSSRNAHGGGAYLTGSATLRNCVVSSNYVGGNLTASYILGAGVFSGASGVKIENCTIADNYADVGTSAGIYLYNGCATNTVIWRNYLPGQENSLADHKNYEIVSGVMGHCDSYPLPPGTANIDTDPQFVNRANGNYRVLTGSGVIDAGTNLVSVTNDYDLVERPLDGNSDAAAVTDIGAFEFDPSTLGSLVCSFSATPNQGVNSIDAVFTATIGGSQTSGVHYFWDFEDDGVFDTDGRDKQVVTNAYGVGVYSVNLVVSNDTGTVTNHLERDYIQVSSDTAYVATNGAHVAPYETWAKAATNLQAAIDEVASGGQVIVSNGVYSVTADITVGRPVTVRSLNGAGATTVERAPGAPACRIFYVSDAGAAVEGMTIRGGYLGSTHYGAGAYIENGAVRSCIVVSNQCTGRFCDGGGVYLGSGGLLENSLVIGNRVGAGSWGSAEGGGVYMAGGRVVNCTVTGNAATQDETYGHGGGIFRAGGVVTNTIVHGNTASALTGKDDAHGSESAYHFSCSPDLSTSANNNTNTKPLFTDGGSGAGLSHARGNYRLLPGSPCIDSGTNIAAVAADLEGVARPKDGDSDGRLFHDMGCYELDPAGSDLQCSFTVNSDKAVGSLEAVFTASVIGNTAGLYCRWDFQNDGSNDVEGAGLLVVTNDYTPGRYSVLLTVSNSGGETTNRLEADMIHVAPPTAYVAASGSHEEPFDSWDTAATNIQDAVDMGLEVGGQRTTVWVAPGAYGVTGQVELNDGVHLRSVNGPLQTTVWRKSGNTRVFYLNHANCLVDGFSVTNGVGSSISGGGPYGGGVWIIDGLMNNCRIVRNQSSARFGEGGGVYMWGGTLRGCLVAGNLTSGQDRAQGGGIKMNGGLVESCTIAGNQAYSANVAGTIGNGGGIYRIGGSVTNTIVYGNTATYRWDDIYGTGACHYSCSPELTTGVQNNNGGNPLFLDGGTGYGFSHVLGDYHVVSGSPAQNTGIILPWMSGATDLEGQPRVMGLWVNMGCYEFVIPAGTLILVE